MSCCNLEISQHSKSCNLSDCVDTRHRSLLLPDKPEEQLSEQAGLWLKFATQSQVCQGLRTSCLIVFVQWARKSKKSLRIHYIQYIR